MWPSIARYGIEFGKHSQNYFKIFRIALSSFYWEIGCIFCPMIGLSCTRSSSNLGPVFGTMTLHTLSIMVKTKVGDIIERRFTWKLFEFLPVILRVSFSWYIFKLFKISPDDIHLLYKYVLLNMFSFVDQIRSPKQTFERSVFTRDKFSLLKMFKFSTSLV